MVNTALLKEQLKRFWGLSALFFLWYAQTIIVPIYEESHGRRLRLLASLIHIDNGYIIFTMMFAPLIAVIVLFEFQNQVKSATTMHSYPLSRNQILATNGLAGMTLMILPLLAMCIIMIFPIFQSYDDLFISPGFGISPVNPEFGALLNSILFMSRLFAFTALSFLFYLSLYMLAAMLSGNSLITFWLCTKLFLLPMALYLLVAIICNFYVFGYYSRFNALDILIYIYPVLFHQLNEGHTLFILVSYFAIILAMVICCVFAANKRALERADDAVVFDPIKNVSVFIFSVFGLLTVGFIFLFMFLNTYAMYIGFAIGFFIAYCIAQFFAEKTFNIRRKIKDVIKFGAIAGSLLLLIIISTGFDIFGYERRIPQISYIEGIQTLDVHTLFDNRDKLLNTELNELLVKDMEIIADLMDLHQAIIDERKALRQFEILRMQNPRAGRHLDILYKLNNGNVIVRRYHLSESFMDDNNVLGLLARSHVSLSLLQNSPDLIGSIRIAFLVPGHRQSESEILISEHDQIHGFVDALMKDHALLTQPPFVENYINITIRFEPEDVNLNTSRMDSLRFTILDNNRGYVRDWLRHSEKIN